MKKVSSDSRRKFLGNAVKGSALVVLSSAAASSLLESCAGSKKINMPAGFPAGTDQSPLPYGYDALENVIDARTMELHYSKHAAAYSKALKEAIAAEGAGGKTTEDILSSISKYSVKMRNNGGGHYNHEMFWKSMRPKRAENNPSGALAAAIDKSFGSFTAFKTQFSEAAKTRFGSGWAWLYMDGAKGLRIGSTPNQDNPLMNVSDIKGFPLLGLDVWEHAYYLKYQNRRPEYIENWWAIVNWDYVSSRYAAML